MNKDSIFRGILEGIIITAITYGLMYLLWTVPWMSQNMTNPKTPFFLAFIPPIILMRFMFVKWKQDKRAQGMLIWVFVGLIATMIFI